MDEVAEALEKYRGLVPLVYDIETMSLDEARPEDMQTAVYLKREADKVIAQHKYKRCLDKVKWCEERISRYTLQQEIQGISWQKEIKFYRRLQNKFIELSKQFKEVIK